MATMGRRRSKTNQPDWNVLKPTSKISRPADRRYLPQQDGSLLAQGYAPTKHTVKLCVTNDLQNITAFRLELLTDPNLPLRWPGPLVQRHLRADRIQSRSRSTRRRPRTRSM